MKQELEEKLIKKYPILFKDKDKPITQSLMAFGCEFSDGWYKIFDELCEYLTDISKQEKIIKIKPEFQTKKNHGYMHVKCPNISFVQVKEKYGTMRVYWVGNGVDNWDKIKDKIDPSVEINNLFKSYYDRVENAIDYVGFLSSKVCEKCGKKGKLYTDGWHMTRCNKCKSV